MAVSNSILVGKSSCAQNGKFPHVGVPTDDDGTAKFSSNQRRRRESHGNRENYGNRT